MNIFDFLYEGFRFEKDKPIRLFESFAGIGFQRMGLELAEIPYEVVGISEIDKFALQAYQAIHSECPNLGSITDIKGGQLPKDIDVFTYSFPCTDLSKAGKQKGLDNTRSGLVYEVLRILHELKEINNLPKVLIMENVVDLVQTKFIKEFNEIQSELEEIGYTNYTQTLNAKNYGIAQNRDRVFMVSILGEYNYNFPKGFELEYRLKDYLEEEVDEKYYLSDKMVNFFKENSQKNTGNRMDDNFIKEPKILMPEATKKGYAEAQEGDGVYINRPHQKRGVVQKDMIQTLKTSGNDVGVVVSDNAKRTLCNTMIANGLVEEWDMIRHSYTSNRMEDLSRKENEKGLSATLTTRPDTLGVVVEDFYKNREPRYYEDVSPTIRAERQGLKVTATAQRGRENGQQLEVSDREYANALTTVQKDSMIGIKEKKLRIRKLTPTETGRLMGMNDEQIKKQLEVVSNAQAYKQHGNGIVAQVIGLIVGMMVYEDENELRETVMRNSHTWLKEKI